MARLFDSGSSEFLETATAIVTAAPLTMSCWFNVSDITAYHGLVGIGSEVDVDLIYLYANGNEAGDYVTFAIWSDGVSTKAFSANGYSANTWHHACGTVSSDLLSAYSYIDGARGVVDSWAAKVVDSVDTTTIGAYTYNGGHSNHCNGRIAEVAIWNAELTAAEVTMLATGYSPGFVRPQNLVFYVPLTRDNDKDIIGGLSMTANGTPTIAAHPPIIYPAAPIFYSIPGGEAPADLNIDIGLDEAAYQGTGVRILG